MSKNLVTAGNKLLERLELFIFGAADECTNEDQPCWNHDGGTIVTEDGDWDNPSRCDVCGEECACTRCSDRTAIIQWNSARALAQRFPVAMYELERDKHEGAIVLRRGVFERYGNRAAWYVTRDAQMGLPSMFPKEAGRKDGLFFMHILSREDEITPYLWNTPEEAFGWWESNRERIVAFTSDRLRLSGEVEKAMEEDEDDD